MTVCTSPESASTPMWAFMPKCHSLHAFQGKGWAAVLAFGVIRGNEFNQCSPGNYPIHLGQQLLLARLLGAQVQVKAALLHAREDATTGGVIYQRGG